MSSKEDEESEFNFEEEEEEEDPIGVSIKSYLISRNLILKILRNILVNETI